MKAMRTMTLAEAQELFRYDEATGTLIWRAHPSSRHQTLVGQPAGCLTDRDTRVVRYRRKTFKVSDIVWLLMTGEWPPAPDLGDRRMVDLSDLTL